MPLVQLEQLPDAVHNQFPLEKAYTRMLLLKT